MTDFSATTAEIESTNYYAHRPGDSDVDQANRSIPLRCRSRDPRGGNTHIGGEDATNSQCHSGGHIWIDRPFRLQQRLGHPEDLSLGVSRIRDDPATEHRRSPRNIGEGPGKETAGEALCGCRTQTRTSQTPDSPLGQR